MTPIVKQRINSFLKHAFFIPDDYLRGLELKKILEAIVSVDHPSIEIVQIGSGESPTFQRHEWPEVRRYDRQNNQNHPIGTSLAGLESLIELDSLG